MEIIIQKYELSQGNNKYILSTQTSQQKLRLSCEEINTPNPSVFISEYTISDFKKISSVFSLISSIKEAQKLFDNIITNQKVSVGSKGAYILLQIFINKNNGDTENFTLTLNKVNQNMSVISTKDNAASMSYQETYEYPTQNVEYNTNQYSSYLNNDNYNQNYESAQFTEIPQIINGNENITYNEYNGYNEYNSSTSGYNYNYENIQTNKTKKRIEETLTLTLVAQPRKKK